MIWRHKGPHPSQKKPEHKQFTYVIEWKAIVLGAPRCKHVYVCVIVCIHTDVSKKTKLIMIYYDIQQELPAFYIYIYIYVFFLQN